MSTKELNQERVKKIEENLQEKISEAFNQFEQVKDLIPMVEKYIDLFDQKITPMFKLAKRTKDLIEKYVFTATIFSQMQYIYPILQKITEKKGNTTNMSV